VAVAVLVLVPLGLATSGVLSASGDSFPAATPPAHCGKGSRPETGVQGRVPASDYASGRAAQGYLCNAKLVSHVPGTGGFKTLRYRDQSGHTCAFYDSTRLFPTDAFMQLRSGFGVIVLDMTHPAHPVKTATLTSLAMLSPHESLLVHPGRGLLAAVMGNAFASIGIVDLYDVRQDCRHPVLLSSTASALLGHESGWSPDGMTFYASSTGGQTFTAIDVSDPVHPQKLVEQYGVNYHGLRLSPDGRTMYVANIGNDLSQGTLPGEGLRILDVSQIQDRVPNPQISVLSNLTWAEGSIPQVAQPFTRHGHAYVLQVDEFARIGVSDPADARVGSARIIDVNDPRHPRVISNLRLEVQQPAERKAAFGDPGGGNVLGGYTGHYCSVPYPDNPRIVACSMINSGLRLFDISHLKHPREVGYVNFPVAGEGSSVMAQPAWDVRRRMVWFTDTGQGFYAVRLTHAAKKLLRRLDE
jgi:hypothetical protein